MKLSTKGRYAVMAMVDLATHARGRPVVLADIAERQSISLSYLEQLFAKLRRADLIASVRGPGGGYLLAQPADQTPVADIVMAVDEPARRLRCLPNEPVGCRDSESHCMTHDLWTGLGDHIYSYLSSVTVGDVVNRRLPLRTDDDRGQAPGCGRCEPRGQESHGENQGPASL